VGVTTTDGGVTWTCLGTQAAYKLVNEPSPDDDLSYLSDSTVGDQSRVTFAAITGQGVKGIQVYTRTRKDDAGARAYRVTCKSGATTIDNGSDIYLATGYQTISQVYETDPNTSAAWTISGVNAAEFGVKTTV
jgi:hypothetical protein